MKTLKFLFLLVLNFALGASLAIAAESNPMAGGTILVSLQLVAAVLPKAATPGVAFATVGFDLTNIDAALGAYARRFAPEIMQQIFQKVDLEKYTRKISGVTDEYAITSSSVSEVLQGYQHAYTKKGAADFTAVINRVRHIKIDYTLSELDDLYQSYLAWMADESLTRDKWPFVKYIISKLIIPKAAEEMNHNSYHGVFVAPTADVAGPSIATVDGFGKVIADLITATTITPIATGAITDTNIFDKVESFVQDVPVKFRAKPWDILMSTTNAARYWKDYRNTNGANANYTGIENLKVDGYQKRIIGIDAMEGSDRFIHTEPGNMLTMYDKINMLNNLEVQKDKRDVILMGDFKRGYGFGDAEKLFVNDQA